MKDMVGLKLQYPGSFLDVSLGFNEEYISGWRLCTLDGLFAVQSPLHSARLKVLI